MLAARTWTPSSQTSTRVVRISHAAPYTLAVRSYSRNVNVAAHQNHEPHQSQDQPQAETGGPRLSASAKLFEDAEKEEAALAERTTRAEKLEARLRDEENWTGDEPVAHAVLRMLVDKYKPLRSGPVRTADEKLRRAPPTVQVDARTLDEAAFEEQSIPSKVKVDVVADVDVRDTVVRTTWGPSAGQSMADVPLLPSVEGHQPWHTTFTVPSHAQASVKYGHIPPSAAARASSAPLSALDDKARRKEREARRRKEQGLRLHSARESTLDYRLGLKAGKANEHAPMRRVNPVTMKGWAGLVEERIERARQEGRFDKITGRGQPLKQMVEERNPFIAREEFLMNRIVQRQGAVPPWVEIQQELESAVNTFRDVARQSWTRRAIRMLTLSRPAAHLPQLTLADVTALRDAEWEARERAYHDTALEEVNALVRKYNGLAPYAVRRAYYARGAELERVYRESGEDILRGIAERAAGALGARGERGVEEDDDGGGRGGEDVPVLGLGDVVRRWIARIVGRPYT